VVTGQISIKLANRFRVWYTNGGL